MKRRNAFTLIELMVAMALIIFIMAILSTAFVAATNTFRSLKSTGDLANRLRAVTTILQRDMAADHFEGKKRLSNPNFWVNGPPQQGFFRIYQGSPPSQSGTNCIIEGTDGSGVPSYRSIDHALAFTIKVRGDQMGDYMTAGPQAGGSVLGSIIDPTTKLPGFGPPEARYQAAGNYNYQWAEVTWFLLPQLDPNSGLQDTTVAGTDSNGTAYPAVPLYTLFRNQRLAVPDNNLVAPAQPAGNLPQFLGVSCWPNSSSGNLYFNSPADLTVPFQRFGMSLTSAAGQFANQYYQSLAQQGASGSLAGADLQVTDVISFDVRLLVATWSTGQIATPQANNPPLLKYPTPNPDPFVTLFDPLFTAYQHGNPAFNYQTGPAVFDTWTSVIDNSNGKNVDYSQWNQPGALTSIPLWDANVIPPAEGILTTLNAPIILAIQVTIRIWDAKSSQTREVTFVQAM